MSYHVPVLAVAVLLAAAPAVAGSLDQPIEAAPVVAAPVASPALAPSADWSGFYLGGQLGFGRLSLDTDEDVFDPIEGEGTLYGIHAGYMRDVGRIVLGAEVDFDRASLTLEDDDGNFAELDSIARAKLRVGYDAGRFLPFVTAGVARMTLSSDDAATDNILEESYDGAFAGLGASYALSDRFLVGAEVLQHRFEDAPVADFDSDLTSITVRGSFRF